jgi:PAS domain S-box-containing protein
MRDASHGIYWAITETAADAIISADHEGKILYFNPSAEILFGCSAAEASLTPLTALIPQWSDVTRIGPSLATGETHIIARSIDLTGVRNDRSKFPVRLSLSVREDGGQTLYTAIVREQPLSVGAEGVVRSKDQKLRDLLDAAPDAMAVVDNKGKMVLINAQLETLFGYRQEDLIGQPIEKLVPQKSCGQHHRHTLEFFANPRVRPMAANLDLYGLHHDGREFPVEISLSPLQREEGTVVLSAIRDVTERRRIQDEVRLLNRELQRRNNELLVVNKELESFSYSVSHDLRAPLRAIEGFSLALLEDCGTKLFGEERLHLQSIRAATERMGELIDDMLALARTARQELVRERVNLSEIARDIVSQLQTTAPQRKVVFTIAPGLIAEGDRTLLRSALENLLGNAWKFTSKQPEGRIEFGIDRNGSAPAYFVRDNGAGFDMRYADRLFAPFQRLHDGQHFPGTGVGLATVQRIIHRHGGRIWAESAVGEGATFRFVLDAGDANRTPHSSAASM